MLCFALLRFAHELRVVGSRKPPLFYSTQGLQISRFGFEISRLTRGKEKKSVWSEGKVAYRLGWMRGMINAMSIFKKKKL